MGVDATVNLKQMRTIAESISNRGNNLGNKILNMLNDVENMQQYWKGDSYVHFVTIVNKTIPTLQKMHTYFTDKLPEEIVAKRNQYAKAMEKKKVTIYPYGVTIFEKLPIKDQGDEIKFNSAGMASLTSKIDQRFDNILKTNLPNIKEDFNSIIWKGSTGDALKKEFKKYMEDTIEAVKKIRTAYRKALEAQAEAMEAAEEGNKRSAIRADISGLKSGAIEAEQQAEKAKSASYDWESNT